MSLENAKEIESLVVNSFGAGLIGAIVTAMLYGLTTLQTYLYFINYPKDEVKIKMLVSIVCTDYANSSLLSYSPTVTFCVYHYLVINFSNPAGLAIINWSLNITVMLNLLHETSVQHQQRSSEMGLGGFTWYLSYRPFLLKVFLESLGFGIETVAYLFVSKTFDTFQESSTVKLAAATPFAVFAVLSDVLIAVSLTNTLITTLIVYAVNRCLLTSAVAITEVIVFILHPTSLWFLAIDFVIGKLYANSLLASLNSRHYLREPGSLSNSNTNSHSQSSNVSSSFHAVVGPPTSDSSESKSTQKSRFGRKANEMPLSVSVALDTFRTTTSQEGHYTGYHPGSQGKASSSGSEPPIFLP
ncbi:hypothetical protein EV361DRAFT_865618 [Lentinula raphanica]|nr:hypothetical protein EV361DRAFT_865618 [Lentinula raphanica]